jgi:hypothetical protein
MKKFWQISKKPLFIALIASVLYLIDALIAGLFVKGASFMWVAFAFWTVFFGASVKDRVKGLIGALIGFFAAIIMMLITNSFSLNIYTISISCLLGVFVVNALVMCLEKTEKFWTNSVMGVFVGIFLTFSGFGVGLNPLNGTNSLFTMLGILAVYAVLGLLCGFCSITSFIKKKEGKKEGQ